MKKQTNLALAIAILLTAGITTATAQDWNQVIKTAAGTRTAKSAIGRASSDNFGYTVAVDGNYAVVGAYQEDEDAGGGNTLNNSGSVIIFYNDAGSWQQIKKIVASDRAANDYFGYSLSISGATVVVGAYLEDEDAAGTNTVSNAGSAYIFSKDQGGTDNWGQVKKIVASDRAATDFFGCSVSISGATVIIGAYFEDEDAAGANTVSAAGSAYIFSKDQGGTDNWGLVKKIVASDRATVDFFGYSVSVSGTIIVVGANQEDEDAAGANTFSDAGSAYIFSVDQGGTNNWGQVKKIVTSDRAANDYFGYSVSISGATVVVGAYQEDEDAAGANMLNAAGSAYIFSKDQGGMNNWGQVKKIVASDRAANDNFGYSVSISGATVVVGAYQEDEDAAGTNTVSNAGSAYIFSKDQGGTNNWGQVKKIVAGDRASNDNFGNSVSVSGATVLVGAYQEDEDAAGANTVSNAGSAYIFSVNQGGTNNWGQQQKIVLIDAVTNQYYGYSVAIDGDYAVVGAYGDPYDGTGTNGLPSAGSAYIFYNNAGNWQQIKKIVASDRAASDNFGYSVAISGTTVVVGAYQEDEDAAGINTLTNAGSAYLFSKDQGGTDNWGQVKKIVASDRGASDNFGYSVAISGTTVLVGANQEDENAAGAATMNDAGSAYLFSKDQGGTNNWGQVKKIVAGDRAAADNFGRSLSISGTTVVVGANMEDEDAAGGNTLGSAGSAYLFSKDQGGTDNWGQVKKIVAGERGASDHFGISVSISNATVVVGAYLEDEDATGTNTVNAAGSAYIFSKDQGGTNNWGQVKKIVASDRGVADYFGYSVSISGATVVVGAYQEDEDAAGTNTFNSAGSAYIFSADQGGTNNWGQVKKIVASDRSANDYFGYSVSISGTTVVVGAYQEDEDASGANMLTSAGSAYFFKGGCSSFPLVAATGTVISGQQTAATPYSNASCELIVTIQQQGVAPILGHTSAKVWVQSVQPSYNGHPYLKRHYEITPLLNAAAATATITLYATQAEFNAFNLSPINGADLPYHPADNAGIANLRIYKYSGTSSNGTGTPDTYTQPGIEINPTDAAIIWNSTDSRWEISFDVTGFSGFFIGNAGNTILPLTVLNFTGTKQTGYNQLNWQTDNEQNTRHFELQRSTDGRNFAPLAIVHTAGTGNNAYSFKDVNVYNSKVYYRLKMVDVDGKYTYSKTVILNPGTAGSLSVFPNPAINTITVSYPRTVTTSQLQLVTADGRILRTMTLPAGTTQTSIDVKTLASGAYYIKMDKAQQLSSFIKQ